MIPDGERCKKSFTAQLKNLNFREAGRPAHFSTNQDCLLATLSNSASFADHSCDSPNMFMCEVIKITLAW
jgi:hypothetical protein